MDDTVQKIQNQQNTAPSQPPTPVNSSIIKEHEPEIVTAPIQPSDKEPLLDKEEMETGVETVSESPQLSEDQKQAGISYAKEATPVSTTPSGNIVLPMTEEEALKTIKTTNTSSSKHWFAVLIEKIYQYFRRAKAA